MHITIYHSNDIHSNFNSLKRIHSYIRNHKTEHDFYFDSGDFTDISSTLVQADGGISAMEIMNDALLDVLCLGNNEIDLGIEKLSTLALNTVPLISANVTDNNHDSIPGISKSILLEKLNKRFLIIGVSPYYSLTFSPDAYNIFFMLGNVKTHDPIEAIKKEIEKHKDNYDFCVLLSHSGHIVDEKLLEIIPEIDLCLGGHSHIITSSKGYSQSGRGETLGKIVLEINDNSIEVIENVQIELEDETNERFDNLFSIKEAHTDSLLSKPLTSIRELSFNPFDESELINFICDILMKEHKCDLAIMHAGIAESNLTQPVSKKSLLHTFPSKLNPTRYSISGKLIRDAINQSFEYNHTHQNGKGAGFRGSVLGTLGYSSNVRINRTTGDITISGVPLNDNKIYNIITDDYLQRGSGYPSLKVDDSEALFDPFFIRDLVEKYLMDKESYNTASIKRVV